MFVHLFSLHAIFCVHILFTVRYSCRNAFCHFLRLASMCYVCLEIFRFDLFHFLLFPLTGALRMPVYIHRRCGVSSKNIQTAPVSRVFSLFLLFEDFCYTSCLHRLTFFFRHSHTSSFFNLPLLFVVR